MKRGGADVVDRADQQAAYCAAAVGSHHDLVDATLFGHNSASASDGATGTASTSRDAAV